MKPDVKPELNRLIQEISMKPMYRGVRMPPSIMAMFEIKETDSSCGILVPGWLSVFQDGRGSWRGTNIGKPLLKERIYNWMKKNNLFNAKTEKGKRGEAFAVARYINKYGNEQFRNKVHIDIYDTAREKTIQEIDRKFSLLIGKITTDIL